MTKKEIKSNNAQGKYEFYKGTENLTHITFGKTNYSYNYSINDWNTTYITTQELDRNNSKGGRYRSRTTPSKRTNLYATNGSKKYKNLINKQHSLKQQNIMEKARQEWWTMNTIQQKYNIISW